MSYNYIYVSQADLNRRVTESYNRGTKEAEKKVQEALNKAKAREKELVKQYNQKIQSLTKQNTSQEKALQKQNQELKEREIQIAKQLGQVNLTKEKVQTLEKELTQVRKSQTDFQNNYIKSQNNTQKRAQMYLDQCLELIRQLETVDVQRFFPKEFIGHQKQMNLAKENIKNKNYEAALALTQVRFQDLSKLLTEAMIKNAQFQALQREAENVISELEKALIENKGRELVYQIDDHQKQDQCDVNYWSYGEYQKIVEKAKQLRKKIEHLKPDDQEDVLKEMIKQASQQKESLDVIVKEASQSLIKTRILEQAADQLHQELIENGWHFKQMNRDDQRDPAAIHYTDGSDNELTIICAKGKDDDDMEVVLDVHGDIDETCRAEIKESVIAQVFPNKNDKNIHRSSECAKTPEEFERKIVETIKER